MPHSKSNSPSSDALLIIITAPSGGGKTTLCNGLLGSRPNLARAITCTTRSPRGEEEEGKDYYFLDAAAFLKRVQAGNFIEHATVYGNSYGTLKSELLTKLRQGNDVLLTVDVQGAATIRNHAAQDQELSGALVTVFVTPRSLGILEQRLKARDQDSQSDIQKRLSVARQEIAQAKHFDYLIVSDTRDEDLRRMHAILDAEKLKQGRVELPSLD